MALGFGGRKLPQNHMLSCALGNRARSVSLEGEEVLSGDFNQLETMSFNMPVLQGHPHPFPGSLMAAGTFFQALFPQIKEAVEAG